MKKHIATILITLSTISLTSCNLIPRDVFDLSSEKEQSKTYYQVIFSGEEEWNETYIFDVEDGGYCPKPEKSPKAPDAYFECWVDETGAKFDFKAKIHKSYYCFPSYSWLGYDIYTSSNYSEVHEYTSFNSNAVCVLENVFVASIGSYRLETNYGPVLEALIISSDGKEIKVFISDGWFFYFETRKNVEFFSVDCSKDAFSYTIGQYFNYTFVQNSDGYWYGFF